MSFDPSEQILIVVRGWLKLACALDNDQVIPADDSGVRPDLPYLTVDTITVDVEDAKPEPIRTINPTSGDIDEDVIRYATGTVQIDGYGRGAQPLIHLAGSSLGETRIKNYLLQNRLGVDPVGGINDVSQLVDDSIEKRFTRDFAVRYAWQRDQIVEDSAAAFDTLEGEFTFNETTFNL